MAKDPRQVLIGEREFNESNWWWSENGGHQGAPARVGFYLNISGWYEIFTFSPEFSSYKQISKQCPKCIQNVTKQESVCS